MVFLSRPLQFFEFGETPLQFIYLDLHAAGVENGIDGEEFEL